MPHPPAPIDQARPVAPPTAVCAHCGETIAYADYDNAHWYHTRWDSFACIPRRGTSAEPRELPDGFAPVHPRQH